MGSTRSERSERRGARREAPQLNPTPSWYSGRAGCSTAALDGWPSGLRRTIGNRVDIVRVGSNPTPSVTLNRVVRTHADREAGCRVGSTRSERSEWRGARIAKRPQLSPTPSVGSLPEKSGVWLSPVERCVRVAEVPGSNPGTPIMRVSRSFRMRTGDSSRAGRPRSGRLAAFLRETSEDRRRRPQLNPATPIMRSAGSQSHPHDPHDSSIWAHSRLDPARSAV